jgi:hypothetical protein
MGSRTGCCFPVLIRTSFGPWAGLVRSSPPSSLSPILLTPFRRSRSSSVHSLGSYGWWYSPFKLPMSLLFAFPRSSLPTTLPSRTASRRVRTLLPSSCFRCSSSQSLFNSPSSVDRADSDPFFLSCFSWVFQTALNLFPIRLQKYLFNVKVRRAHLTLKTSY